MKLNREKPDFESIEDRRGEKPPKDFKTKLIMQQAKEMAKADSRRRKNVGKKAPKIEANLPDVKLPGGGEIVAGGKGDIKRTVIKKSGPGKKFTPKYF